jgi:hypothetical protein
MEAALQRAEETADHLRQQLAELQLLGSATWEHQAELDRLLARQRELDALLSEQPEDRRTDLAGLEVVCAARAHGHPVPLLPRSCSRSETLSGLRSLGRLCLELGFRHPFRGGASWQAYDFLPS